MTDFADSPIAKQAVATATVIDCYAGELRAFLIPQRTTRGGRPVTVYRWLDQRGFCCDGLRCGFPANRMIAKANGDRRFSNVVAA
jgi:hypothetical protein